MGSLSKGGTIALSVISGLALVAVVLELLYLLWSRRWRPDDENEGSRTRKRTAEEMEAELTWRRSTATHWGLLGVLFAIKEESGDELADSEDGKGKGEKRRRRSSRLSKGGSQDFGSSSTGTTPFITPPASPPPGSPLAAAAAGGDAAV